MINTAINLHPWLKRTKTNLVFVFLFFASAAIGQPFDTLLARAKATLFANNYASALEQYNTCLKEAQRLKDGLKIGNSYIGIGICYDKTSDYENALTNYFKALSAYESVNNIKKQGGTLKNIGNTYRVLKSFGKSSEFFEQALEKYTEVKDSVGLSSVSNDLGLLYMDQQKHDTATLYFSRVITVFKQYASKEVNAFALNNLGLTYANKKSFDTSRQFYLQAEAAMKKIANDYGLALVYNNTGHLFIQQQRYAEALDYSTKGLEMAKKVQSRETIAYSYENLATCYRALRDYKTSNDYFDQLLSLRDTIFREESARSYAEMETRYQNEKKKKEIIVLKKDNAIKDLDLTNQRRMRTFLLITLAFIIAIAIIIFRNSRAKQRLNNQLAQLNNQLNEANQSKTKLLSIISHDLRTPVSSLFNFLQIQKNSPGRLSPEQQDKYNKQINSAAENVLTTMEDVLIWSKSQMERFEPNLESVGMDEFGEEIIALHQTAADNKQIELIAHIQPGIYLHTDPNFLKISVRNLLSNAIKFTPGQGRVELIIAKAATAVLITVKDNGPGISAEQQADIFAWNSIRSDSSGLGLRLAKEFTEKLNGTIQVASSPGEGTAFTLSFAAQ